MGLGDMIKGLFGVVEDERLAAQEALDRARYAALQEQAEKDRDAAEKLADVERENREKLEEAFSSKAEAEARAHEDKMRLEREKMDMVKESNEAQMKMMMEANERQRKSEREADQQRREFEKNARDAEMKAREENEQKREKERAEAKAREDQKQKEATNAINEANKSVMEMKDKTHADITKLVIDNQKNKDDMMKENLKIMAEKDAANADKLDKLTNNYQSQVKEAQETAKQREDALHLERKAVDDKYRKDMENMSILSKEERDKMTTEYHTMIKEKDNELSKNQREKDAKMDELNKNHLNDLKKAHDDYNKLQESSKAEMARLQKEKEDVLREKGEKLEEAHNKMLEMAERKNEQILDLANYSAYSEAVKIKEHSEFLRISKCSEELSPIKDLKKALVDNATHSCELWSNLEHSKENADEIKDEIIKKSQAMKKIISELIHTIDSSRSLGEQKKSWKVELMKLSTDMSTYATAVSREIKDEETTKKRLRELEDECDKLNSAIHNLPDMTVESMESLVNRSARGAILSAENRGVTKAIAAAKKEKDEKAAKKEKNEIGETE